MVYQMFPDPAGMKVGASHDKAKVVVLTSTNEEFWRRFAGERGAAPNKREVELLGAPFPTGL